VLLVLLLRYNLKFVWECEVMALWKLFVASMWFILYFRMVSNMLVAHSMLF
jgi:hypothetical protein